MRQAIIKNVIYIAAMVIWLLCASKTWTLSAWMLSQPSDALVFGGIMLIIAFIAASFAFYIIVNALVNRFNKDSSQTK